MGTPKTARNTVKTVDVLRAEQAGAALYQEDVQPLEYDDIAEPTREESALQNLLDDLSDTEGAQISVYRVQRGKPLEFLFNPDFCDNLLGAILSQLQLEYGKGLYQIQGRLTNGSLKVNRQISVGEPPASMRREPAPVQRVDNGSDMMASMMQMQMQMMTQSRADMMAMMQANNESQTRMVTALMGRPERDAPESLGIKDIFQFLPTLKDLIGGGQKSDDMKVFMQGIEFARSVQGGGDSDNTFTDLLKTGLSNIGALSALMPKQAEAPRPVQRAPVPVQHAAEVVREPEQAPAQTSQGDADLMAICMRVLHTGITRDSDPTAYACVLMDMVGDEQAIMLVNHPQYVAIVCQQIPEATDKTAWLEALRDAVNELSADEGGDIVGESDKGGDNVDDLSTINAGTTGDNGTDG